MPKLLAEFLQEQQEPFALEVYLVERGCRKRLSSDKYVAPDCSYFVRAVFKQFIMAGEDGGRKNASMAKSKRRVKINAGEDGFSSARSSTSLLNSSSESDALHFLKCGNCFFERGVDADTELKMRGEEDCEQLSSVSVLGEPKSDQDSLCHYEECNFKKREESSNSTSRCRLKQPKRCRFEESREIRHCPYDQYVISKRALRQKKQLLIDCTQELQVMEKCGKEETKAVLGDGEIWKYICEKLWMWSQDSITQNNVLHLLHSEFLEWNAIFEKMKFEICAEIENDVLENVINDIITW